MYEVNDWVVYGIDGVCRISDITIRPIAGVQIQYYVLKPCGAHHSTIYVPTGNKKLVSMMRKALSRGEVIELIRTMPNEQTIWIDDNNAREATYESILFGTDRAAIVRLIKTLNLRQQELKLQKKKLRSSDERLLREAERRLYEEFAHALKIDTDQVLSFISNQIQAQDPSDQINLRNA